MSPKKKNIPIEYDDPFEAIFALNIGDFVTEDLLSDELLSKIRTKIDSSESDKSLKLKDQIQELVSIYSIDKTLNLLGFAQEDGYIVYDSIATTIAYMTGFDCCNIYLIPDILPMFNVETDKELFLFGTSCRQKGIPKGFTNKEDSIFLKAFRKNKIVIENLSKIKNIDETKYPEESKAKVFASFPMAFGSHSIGMLSLYSKEEKKISAETIALLESIAGVFSHSIKLQDILDEAKEILEENAPSHSTLARLRAQLTSSIGDLGQQQQTFVESLSEVVDAKSEFTKDHSKKVAELGRKIAIEMQLNEKRIDLIYYSGLLQGIGKIVIPSEVFTKKDKLSQEDWKKIQDHPNIGVDLLMKVNFLSEVVPYVHHYRERWDGQGKPEGLSGMSIPLGSRIIAVADAYQAMTSNRSYRDIMSPEEAIKILKSESGIKWDPDVVESLARVVEN